MAFEATQHPRPLPHPVCLYVSPLLARYGFPKGHPFGIDRQDAFWREAQKQGLDKRISLCEPRQASRDELLHFHTAEYVDRVERASKTGDGFLDNGDTPAFPGVYEAAATVVGAALDGLWRIMEGKCVRTFQPIGGLHHARRDRAAGFCVFNDIGVVIETLRLNYGVKRVGYIDIDVHHGDGLYYPFESDQDMIFADIHEDGSYLPPTKRGRVRPRVPNLTFPYRRAPATRNFLPRGEKSKRTSKNSSRNSSFFNAAPTPSPTIRLRTYATRPLPMPMRQSACARWLANLPREDSWPLAAAATTAPIWPGRGAGC